jgi:hypothetical protein
MLREIPIFETLDEVSMPVVLTDTDIMISIDDISVSIPLGTDIITESDGTFPSMMNLGHSADIEQIKQYYDTLENSPVDPNNIISAITFGSQTGALNFSKPVLLTIPMDMVDGSYVAMHVIHGGVDTSGMTSDRLDTTCDG